MRQRLRIRWQVSPLQRRGFSPLGRGARRYLLRTPITRSSALSTKLRYSRFTGLWVRFAASPAAPRATPFGDGRLLLPFGVLAGLRDSGIRGGGGLRFDAGRGLGTRAGHADQ